MRYVISYDISSDRIRNKAAKLLANYGQRVQYSVFECELRQKQLEKLYSELAKLISEDDEAGVRIYGMCANCTANIKVIGLDKKTVYGLTDEESKIFIV